MRDAVTHGRPFAERLWVLLAVVRVVVVTTAVTLLASARSGDGDARTAEEEDTP